MALHTLHIRALTSNKLDLCAGTVVILTGSTLADAPQLPVAPATGQSCVTPVSATTICAPCLEVTVESNVVEVHSHQQHLHSAAPFCYGNFEGTANTPFQNNNCTLRIDRTCMPHLGRLCSVIKRLNHCWLACIDPGAHSGGGERIAQLHGAVSEQIFEGSGQAIYRCSCMSHTCAMHAAHVFYITAMFARPSFVNAYIRISIPHRRLSFALLCFAFFASGFLKYFCSHFCFSLFISLPIPSSVFV